MVASARANRKERYAFKPHVLLESVQEVHGMVVHHAVAPIHDVYRAVLLNLNKAHDKTPVNWKAIVLVHGRVGGARRDHARNLPRETTRNSGIRDVTSGELTSSRES